MASPLKRGHTFGYFGFSVWSDGECTRLPYDSVPAHRMTGLCLEHGLIRQRMLDVVRTLPNVSIKLGVRVVGIDQTDPSDTRLTPPQGSSISRGSMRVAILN